MRTVFLVLLGFLAASSALAQSQFGAGTLVGRPTEMGSAGPPVEVPNQRYVRDADTNTQLKTFRAKAGQRMKRNGFRQANDGGGAEYDWRMTKCAAPDDGAQVQPVDSNGVAVVG